MFRRQFRLCLEDFKIVLDKIYSDIAPNEKMSRVASCGGMGVTAELKLLITLRILAGGSYLDMIWYHIPVDNVRKYFHQVVAAINRNCDNVVFDCNDKNMIDEIKEGWSKKQFNKTGKYLTPDVLLALDGLQVEIKKPKAMDLGNGADVQKYFNRKLYYSVACQALCDSNCYFRSFEIG